MKTIFVLVFTFCFFSVNAQENSLYKPFSEFKNDTAAYLKYNFIDRDKNYKGRPLKDVIDNLELTILSYRFCLSSWPIRINGIHLYFNLEKNNPLVINWEERIDHKIDIKHYKELVIHGEPWTNNVLDKHKDYTVEMLLTIDKDGRYKGKKMQDPKLRSQSIIMVDDPRPFTRLDVDKVLREGAKKDSLKSDSSKRVEAERKIESQKQE